MYDPAIEPVVVNTILVALVIGAMLFLVLAWYNRQLAGYVAAKFAARASGLAAMEEAQRRVHHEESIRFGLRVVEPEAEPVIEEEPEATAVVVAPEPAAPPVPAAEETAPVVSRKRRAAKPPAPPPPPLYVRVLRTLLSHAERD